MTRTRRSTRKSARRNEGADPSTAGAEAVIASRLAETTGPSILDVLAHDHRALEQILKELATTPSSEPAERTARFSQLQALLQSHARAEEEVVYRRLQQVAPDAFKTLEAFEEHHVADLLMQELASDCPGDAGWTAKLRVLEELLQHHIKEEELDVFAEVRAHVDAAEQVRMASEFRALKHEDLERFLSPLRRATPAFAGRATIYAQAAAGRLVRRGELYLRRALSRDG